jgi:hypothetical protein
MTAVSGPGVFPLALKTAKAIGRIVLLVRAARARICLMAAVSLRRVHGSL